VIRERELLGVPFVPRDRQPLGLRPRAPAFEQRRDVIEPSDLGEPARRRQGGVAIAAGDVEHELAGVQVGRLAERLADDLKGGADDGVVAGAPGDPLPALAASRMEAAGRGRFRGAAQDSCHGSSPWLGLV